MEKNLTLELYKNVDVERYYVNSLNVNQVDSLAQILGYSHRKYSDKFSLSQYAVSIIYNQMIILSPKILDAPVTLNSIIERVDFSLIRNFEPSFIQSNYPINERAYFTVLLPRNFQTRIVTIGNVSDEDVNSIWSNTKLSYSNSLEHKRRVIDIALSLVSSELNNSNAKTSSFPAPTAFALIPENIRVFFSYDFLNSNISKRILEVERMRSDCISGSLTNEQVCSGIVATEYGNFIASIGNLSQIEDSWVSFNVSKTLEPVNTIEKLEREIKEVSSLWKVSLIGAMFFFILAFLLVFLSFQIV